MNKRFEILITEGIIDGLDAQAIAEMLGVSFDSIFRQRKNFTEYYYNRGFQTELSFEQILTLSNKYCIKLY